MCRVEWVAKAAFLTALAAGVAGCGVTTFGSERSLSSHFTMWQVAEPRGVTVEVCSAYGCRTRQRFAFTAADIAALRRMLHGGGPPAGPAEERRRIAAAIAWIERRVGPATGTHADRPLIDFFGSGDPGQMDCVDEATNTTSYLSVLAAHGLLRHHRVEAPISKGGFTRWPHYGAVLAERHSGARWVVDSSVRANGLPPIIQPAARWYVPG